MNAEVSPSRLPASLHARFLRCEYQIDPLGLDVAQPRLSWTLASGQRGEIQSARQILVASTPELLARDKGDLWDTGKIASSQQNQIEYEGQVLDPRRRCHWKVRVWDEADRSGVWSRPALWTMGLLHPSEWRAQWIGMAETLMPRPEKSDQLDPQADDHSGLLATPRYLRREFALEGEMVRATLYATALGLYELRLNGHRVGDHLLAPGWTDYHKRVQYQTYDVTSHLRGGSNAIGAVLGNGWYAGLLQNWPCAVRNYGDEPLLLMQLEIELRDGRRQTLCTDGSWQGTIEGPLRFSGIYEGETYDARREMPGWDLPGFRATNWAPVHATPLTETRLLVWPRSEPIRATQEIAAVSVTEPKPGVYVFAFPQNLVGWARFAWRGQKGETVELQYGEMFNPDGTVFTGNLRVVCQRHQSQLDRYTFRGGEVETYQPHFTYHGFQYVEVRGLHHRPNRESLTGIAFHTACRETGSFHCSEPLLDRLAQNILWSQRGNFMSVPTDCPQRDERCGYTGDAQFFIRTAVYQMDIAAFFNKWLVDLCADSQLPGGWFADHAPHYAAPGAGPNIGWSDAGIICPYEIYRTYGDTRVIRQHYAAMKRKLAWLRGESRDHLFTGCVGNGDWLNQGGGVSKEVLGTAYAAHDFQLMAEMAAAIGETRDAEEFRTEAELIRDAFARAYLDSEGGIKESSQSGYALAFTLNLVPERLRKKMTDRFVAELRRFDWHPATGFIGTPRLLPALHAAGRDDAAYRLLLSRTPPSWLHPVTLGATTIWELWDSFDGKTPKGGMNSLNHYAFGSVGEYLFRHIGGIQCETPGFAHIRIEPVIENGLTWAATSYDSIRGRIETQWKMQVDALHLEIAIPPNCFATVFVPATANDQIFEGDSAAQKADGVFYLRTEKRATVYRVGSGRYHFRVQHPSAKRS